nr:hypothetical protein LSAT_8X101220 [Tanacetum cinerariifolium]
MDLHLNESQSSQQSGLGSGIPSLVSAFGSKVIKCGAGSSLSTSSASREGDRGDPDFRSLLYGGRIPIICSLSDKGDKGEGPNIFYPQPSSVISNLNSLFLFISTMCATTSSPLLVREKASEQGLMKSRQLVRTRFWLAPFFLLGSRAISFLSVGLCHPLEQVREPRVNELKEPHDRIVHRLFKREIAPKETTYVFLGYAQSGYRRYDVKSKRLNLMLRISLTLQAALISIFCQLSACSADLRGFQSPGTSFLFSLAITVSFLGSDYSIISAVQGSAKVYPFLKLRVKDGYWNFRTDSSCSSGSIAGRFAYASSLLSYERDSQ